jgi:hypothetical protein
VLMMSSAQVWEYFFHFSAEEKTEKIGKGLGLKYKIGQSVDRRDFYISLSLVFCSQEDGICQPDMVIFSDASVPVPFCNDDKSFSWPSCKLSLLNYMQIFTWPKYFMVES